jgi:hypothetical protein
MPRFFFHVENDGVQVKDEIGLALPDEEAAWFQAVRSGRDLIRAGALIGGEWGRHWVRIEDESGIPVDCIPLAQIACFAESG